MILTHQGTGLICRDICANIFYDEAQDFKDISQAISKQILLTESEQFVVTPRGSFQPMKKGTLHFEKSSVEKLVSTPWCKLHRRRF